MITDAPVYIRERGAGGRGGCGLRTLDGCKSPGTDPGSLGQIWDQLKTWSISISCLSTFIQVSHDRGIKTWCVQTTYPECHYSHGPQHWKNKWQGKDCHTVQRITTNIVWSSSKPFFGSADRKTRAQGM